jgi:hypothetical protein
MRAALFQLTSVALLCVPIAGNVIAQTSSSPQRPGQTAAQPDKGETVSVVGCLEQGNATGAATNERRSETGAANANDFFVRASAPAAPAGGDASAGSPSTATRTTESSGAAGGSASGTMMYRITGLDGEQLRPHVGHRVELQGHLTGNMATSGNGSRSGTAAGTSGTTAGTTAGTSGTTASGTATSTGTASSSGSTAGSGAGRGQGRDQRGGQGHEGRGDVAGVLHATAIKMVSTSCQ